MVLRDQVLTHPHPTTLLFLCLRSDATTTRGGGGGDDGAQLRRRRSGGCAGSGKTPPAQAYKGQVVDGHHTCDPSNCVRRGLAALGRRVLFLVLTNYLRVLLTRKAWTSLA